MARTFWMRVFAATYWVLVAIVVYLLTIFVLPDLDNPDVVPFLVIFGVFLGLFIVVALAATLWRGAPRRPWFWLAGLIPAVALMLLNAPYIPYSLTHPGDVQGFTAALPLLVATLVVVASGWFSFRDARAQAGSAAPTRRAAMALTIAVSATFGAIATAILGAGGGSATAAEVTSAAVLEARDVTFVQESLGATAGETLGLVVVNHDSFAHSFDIDALNLHVQVPANASTLVAVTPAAAGSLQFYCGVPGHEVAMKGTITVQ
ncbi:MAG TPA: cupredoxin domain-containing protein [Candidatus Limnocylindria bacterium]|nr:cupredoxin domain-containing protein [Candidatus Limnocylindria bacterium]